LPKSKAASSPVVSRIVDSGREIHAPRLGSGHYPVWARALQQSLETGRRAEPQALAKSDLNFGFDRHLPEKLKHPGRFLP